MLRRAGRGAAPYRNGSMALPKDVKFVTFDCYGTLIDWETGVFEAFQKEADKDGFTIDRDVLIPRFIEIQREIQHGSYELYAEVLRRAAVRVGQGGRLGASRTCARTSCPTACRAGCRSGRPTRSSSASRRSTRRASSRTSTTSCSARRGGTSAADFDLVVTAQQVRSYKPDPAHFKECARRIDKAKKHWVHIASGYPTDVEPCLKSKIPVIWVNRHGQELESGQKKPDAEVKTFRDAGKLLGRRLGAASPCASSRSTATRSWSRAACGRPTPSRCARAARRC